MPSQTLNAATRHSSPSWQKKVILKGNVVKYFSTLEIKIVPLVAHNIYEY